MKFLSHVQLCNPMDSSLLGSSVHGISQAKLLEWAAISFSKGDKDIKAWMYISGIKFYGESRAEKNDEKHPNDKKFITYYTKVITTYYSHLKKWGDFYLLSQYLQIPEIEYFKIL